MKCTSPVVSHQSQYVIITHTSTFVYHFAHEITTNYALVDMRTDELTIGDGTVAEALDKADCHLDEKIIQSFSDGIETLPNRYKIKAGFKGHPCSSGYYHPYKPLNRNFTLANK